jgi:hypothetical protein
VLSVQNQVKTFKMEEEDASQKDSSKAVVKAVFKAAN